MLRNRFYSLESFFQFPAHSCGFESDWERKLPIVSSYNRMYRSKQNKGFLSRLSPCCGWWSLLLLIGSFLEATQSTSYFLVNYSEILSTSSQNLIRHRHELFIDALLTGQAVKNKSPSWQINEFFVSSTRQERERESKKRVHAVLFRILHRQLIKQFIEPCWWDNHYSEK